MNQQVNSLKNIILFLIITMGLILTETAFAATGTNYSLGQISLNVTDSLGGLAKVITAGCYITGFGFGVGSIIKYKGHRDNPSQITVGQPIVLAFVSLAFVFMPMIFVVAGNTIFGSHALVGGTTGVSSF